MKTESYTSRLDSEHLPKPDNYMRLFACDYQVVAKHRNLACVARFNNETEIADDSKLSCRLFYDFRG